MGMLGHQVTPVPQQPPAQPEIDTAAADVEALESELEIAELSAENTGLDRRAELVATVRSRLEPLLAQPKAADILLRATVSHLAQALLRVPPQLDAGADSPENKFRTGIIELLARVPLTELPKTKVPDILQTCHHVLENDHEDNGILAQRLLLDLHKTYKGFLENETGPFFAWLEALYTAVPSTVDRLLEAASSSINKTEDKGSVGTASLPLVPARESLKITIEVALMVFYLMQAYPKRMVLHGPTLVPLMVKTVALTGPNKQDVPASAAGVYHDFRLAQIKTLAFMIVVSRAQQMGPLLTPHRDEVCSSLIRIMEAVPDVLATRKELLTCMRNMMNTPFKAGLQSKMDALLDEETLLGSDRVCVEALRQLAYMNLAELVAFTKGDLTLEQLRRVVKLYTRNALDTLNPSSLQTTSLRLLYNIIEVLFARRSIDAASAEAYRDLLSSILECMVAKLGALRRQVPRRKSEVRDLEDSRKIRKVSEAAAAADSLAAGKKALAGHKRKIKEEAAVVKAKRDEEAAAAAVVAAEEAAVAAVTATAATEQDAAMNPTAAGGVEGAAATTVKDEPMDIDGGAAAAVTEEADKEAIIATAHAAAATEQEEEEEEEEEEKEEASTATDQEVAPPPPPSPFRVLLQTAVGVSAKDREFLEFRTLLHTVLSCLKNVLYITVAYHTSRGLQQPLPFVLRPWSSRPNDVRSVSHILSFGLPAISFFEHTSPPGFDSRDALADLFTSITDGREFADIFAPRMNYLFELILSNRWYMRFLRHLIEGEAASRSFVNRHAIATVLRFLVAEKLHALEDMTSGQGKLTLELLEICFEALPRIQSLDATKPSQALAHHGLQTIERVVLPHIIAFLRTSFPRMARGGTASQGYMRAMRSLFYCLAVSTKFLEIQAAVGATGLHLRIVDFSLGLMQGPSTRTREEEEAAAELCLLVPARLEHLISVLPRMMHAVVLALNGSDRSVHVALRVLDVWVESFNPEFIERSMAAVTKPLMAALWSHIRPPPHPFGAKVAEMVGKMGGRGRRWLGEGTSVDFKTIPEYGLRVILAFPPHTSFLVPLDRCVQLAWTTVESGTAEVHRRKNALHLLQICVGTLARLHLPANMLKTHSVLPSAGGGAAAAAPASGEEPTAAAVTPTDAPVKMETEETTAAVPPPPSVPSVPETKEKEKPELIDDALRRLQALLFGNGPNPELPAELNWPSELGVKTKKQHAAEKQMLETVLTAIMSSVAVDSELEGANARKFAHATCRHFALLLAAGWAATPNPPPAPPSSRVDKYNVRGGIPAYVATLKHLQPHVLLDAFQQGLKQTNAKARAGVVECMCVFLDTLAEVGQVQQEHRKATTAAAAEETPAATANADDDDKANKGGVSDEPYLTVQQDLVMRAMHCCYGDSWASRLGGIAALQVLTKRVPQRWLVRAASFIIKALMGVLRALPDNATQEQQEVTEVLLDIVRKALDLPESALEVFIADPSSSVPPPAVAATTQKEVAAASDDGGETPMEQEQEEEAAAQTGKRGKRTKRGGAAQPPRKRQQRQTSVSEEASPTQPTPAAEPAATAAPATPADGGGAAERDDPLNEAARRLQNDLLSSVVSSKSNDAVRTAGTKCLQLLTHFTGLTVGALMKNMLERTTTPQEGPPDFSAGIPTGSQKNPSATTTPQASTRAAPTGAAEARTPATQMKGGQQTSRLGALLERRMLPLRSISTQTNYAHSTAFLLRTCAEQLEFTPALATFLADCCTIIEQEANGIASAAVVRNLAPKPEMITKLHIACMEVLVASLNWPAFLAAGDVKISAKIWGQQIGQPDKVITGKQLCDRICKVFIHRLGSTHDKILELATCGLKATVANNLLEKPVLHEGLRPILFDLANYSRMTVHLLRHVHRLLDLLSVHFNVTLGQKLTEHLQKWMEADKYVMGQNPQNVAWEAGSEWEVAASMLDIFHKLPEAAKSFLETHEKRPGIVVLTIGLEEALYQLPSMHPSKMWSPYRAPLTRFLNRYAEESVEYFLDSKCRLSKPEYFLRLLDIVRNPLGRPLLEALKGAPEKFIAVLDDKAADEDTLKAQINCIHLLRAIVKISPSWLPEELYKVLLQRWRPSARLERAVPNDVVLPGDQAKESKWLAHLLLNYVRRHPQEIDALFELLTTLSLHTAQDFSFIKDYLSRELPRELSMDQNQALLLRWIELFKAGKATQGEYAVNMIRYLISPSVLWAVTHGQESIFTVKVAESLVTDIFRSFSSDTASYGEQLQAEAIQLCSIILQHAHFLFKDQRKDLIQYVWTTLKQDNLAKPYAFLCVAHFFHAFRGAQDNVVLKAFINMVRMTPSDTPSRDAVRQAIDIVIPILIDSPEAQGSTGGDAEISDVVSPGSFPSEISADLSGAGGSKKRPGYAAHLRKVLAEEGMNSSTFFAVLQMVVCKRELFYDARATFIPYMLKSLRRYGLHNPALENRILAVDMASTLLWWDAQAALTASGAAAANENEPQPMETDATTAEAGGDNTHDAKKALRLTPEMDEEIIDVLIRIAFSSCEVREQVRDEAGWRKLHAHCLDVLKDAARYRPPVPIKMTNFEKFLTPSLQQQQHQVQVGQPLAEASAPLITGLRILNIFFEFQPDNIVLCCPTQIASMIEPAIYSKHRAPVELFSSVCRSLFTAFPPNAAALLREGEGAPAVAFKLQMRIRDILSKYLNHIAEPNTFTADFFWFSCNCVTVMKASMQAAPGCMHEVMYSLLKAMNRFSKDHNQQPQAGLLFAKTAPREVPTDAEYSTGSWFIYHALNIAVPAALVLSAEHRKLFLSTLVMLITGQAVRQGQTDAAILFAILGLMRGWLLTPKQTHLTHKELLVLLQRIAQVDRLHAIPITLKASWDTQFLDLLYMTITTKKEENFGEEVFMRVERTFCCGLQSADPITRQKFFQLYSERILRDLHDRLRYIIQYQDWDFLSHTFWLKHAVALLFDCLHMRDPITLAYNSAHVPPLFNYKDSLKFPGGLLAQAGAAQQSKPPTEGTGGGIVAASVPATDAEGGGGDIVLEAPPAVVDPSLPAQPPTDLPILSTGGGGAAAAAGGAASGSKASGSKGSRRDKERTPAPVLDIDLPESLRTQLQEHLEFLGEQNGLRSDSLVSCLIEQVQTDPLVSHHLWVLLFPIVWTSLQKDQQTGLAKPIIQLLSKEHHLRQAYLRPTVGQTLLDGISMSQPQPKIPAEMIKYMGRHFHAWHTAISMLESHVGLFPQDMRCFDAVCDLYSALGEEDMRAGLWQRRAAAEETKTAIALQQHGYIADAQGLYLEMMSRGVSGGVSGVTKSEMVLWHNQYLACCMELNQWDVISEYAKSIDNSALQLEASAKNHDWIHLKQMAVPKAQVEEGPEFTMIKTQMQLSEMSLMEVDKLCKTTLNQCVVRWWQMPESSPWSYAPVLHSFQRAVELMESFKVMLEFSAQGGSGGQYQDLRDITDTWKLRTPNEWEPVRWWSDLLSWRNQVYNMTIRQFSGFQTPAPNLHQMGYRDKAWSVNRLGHVARLHHLPDACCHIINSMYQFNAMEVQEAFVKVQEQAKAFMLRPTEHLHGLNLINSTNMDYFQAPHQAEMICLKAQFLQLLGEHDNAHNTFSEALTLWPMCPDAWVNWGRFCDSRYTATKQTTWLEFAASCYGQGIRLVGTEARTLVPRLLHLFMLDVNGPETVGNILLQQATDMPSWVWLPWLPQLITSLQRPETAVARRILTLAAQYHPQYVYWQIRPAIALLKEQAVRAVNVAVKEKAAAAAAAGGAGDKKKASPAKGGAGASKGEDTEMADAPKETAGGEKIKKEKSDAAPAAGGGAGDRSGSPAIEKPMELIAYDNCKEVLEALRAKQSLTLQSLDVLISELGGQKFSSRTDERLLAVVYTLQFRTYKQALPASAAIPAILKKELASVCRACGGREPPAAAAGTPAAGTAAAAAPPANAPFSWARCQIDFAHDLDPESDNTPKTLGELGERLKGWRTLMESMVEDLHPPVIKLEEHAPGLAEMLLEEIEMPCQAPYCPDGPEAVFIERIDADVEVVRRACSSSRRITVIGSDGQARTFLVQPVTQQLAPGHSEERVGQFLRAANTVMATHPESRRRGLAFAAPRSLALMPSGRLIEDDPSSTLYIDAYETYCARYGREPDAPILHFKSLSFGEDGTSADNATRRAAYTEIIEKMVTENVFSQYMYKTMVENSRVMWTFKRQFALSTAMSAVACYSLRLTGRIPNKVLVSKAKGEITHLELSAMYNDRLQLDMAGETVPFRLTRNMSAFIGPHGFEGTLVAAAVASAQGLQQERSPISSMLALFLRDDLLAYAQRRLAAQSIAAVKLMPSQVELAVMSNVTQTVGRLEKIGPKNSVTPATVPGAQTLANPQAGMRELMAVAMSATQLCQMDPTWQSWL